MKSSSTSMMCQTCGPRLLAMGVLTLAFQVALSGCQQIRELTSAAKGSAGASAPPTSQVNSASGEKSNPAFAAARALEKSQRIEKAATAYEEILNRHPDFAPAHHRLAVVYERLGKEQLSQQHFESALSLAPQNCDLLCDYGYSRYLRNDLEMAEQKLREALVQQPEMKRAQMNLGLVEACTGRERAALDRFRAAGCNDSDSRANLAYCLMKVKKWPQAAEQLQLAFAQNPNSKVLQKRMQEIEAIRASDLKSNPDVATASFAR